MAKIYDKCGREVLSFNEGDIIIAATDYDARMQW